MSKIYNNSNSLDFNYLAGNTTCQDKKKSENNTTSQNEDSFYPQGIQAEGKINDKDSYCSFIDPYLKGIIEIFSPVLNFMSGITEIKSGSTKEETIKTFDQLILDTESKIKDSKMSDKAKGTLSRVYKSIREIESRKDLSNLDLNELITHWKETKNHRALLHMHEKIKNGECLKMSNEKMRTVFLEGLESFADSLDEALGHPPSKRRDEVVEKLQQGASAVVDNVDIINKRGGDEDLTIKDKKQIAENFQIAKEKVEEIISDPELSTYIANSREQLMAWNYLVVNFLEQWLEEMKESEEKEQKEREEKICAYRLQKKKEADKFHIRAKAILKEVNEYFFLKEEARRKLYSLCTSHEQKELSKRQDLFNKKFLEFLGKEESLIFARDFAEFQISSSNLFDGYIDCSNHDHH